MTMRVELYQLQNNGVLIIYMYHARALPRPRQPRTTCASTFGNFEFRRAFYRVWKHKLTYQFPLPWKHILLNMQKRYWQQRIGSFVRTFHDDPKKVGKPYVSKVLNSIKKVYSVPVVHTFVRWAHSYHTSTVILHGHLNLFMGNSAPSVVWGW